MLFGITASQDSRRPAAPAHGGYNPVGVRFIGWTGSNGQCAIKLNGLSCTNNGFLSWAAWFKNPDWVPATTAQQSLKPWLFQCDSGGSSVPTFRRNTQSSSPFGPLNEWAAEYGNNSSFNNNAVTSSSHLTNNAWIHVMATADVNHASGSKIFKNYVGDVDRTDSLSSDPQVAWTFTMNGKDFWLGSDSNGDSVFCDIADFSFWPGKSFLTAGDISLTTRRLFIDASGLPVNPSTAIAALGTPAIMCEGGVSGFLSNSRGNSGALGVPAFFDSPIASPTNP
jgi:hypothetical protein